MSADSYRWEPKHPSAELDYAVDFESECARTWSRWTDFAQGDKIRVYVNGPASGFEFEATTGGRSGGRMPAFPGTLAATVRDGSIVWTAREISNDSLVRTINGTPTWAADTGITIANEVVAGQVAIADISGGTDGQEYRVTVTASMSDGNDVVLECVLPVERA